MQATTTANFERLHPVMEVLLNLLQHTWRLALFLCNKYLSAFRFHRIQFQTQVYQFPKNPTTSKQHKLPVVDVCLSIINIARYRHIHIQDFAFFPQSLFTHLHHVKTLELWIDQPHTYIPDKLCMDALERISLYINTSSHIPRLTSCQKLSKLKLRIIKSGDTIDLDHRYKPIFDLNACEFFPPSLSKLKLFGEFRLRGILPSLQRLTYDSTSFRDLMNCEYLFTAPLLQHLSHRVRIAEFTPFFTYNQFPYLTSIRHLGTLDASILPRTITNVDCYSISNSIELPLELITLRCCVWDSMSDISQLSKLSALKKCTIDDISLRSSLVTSCVTKEHANYPCLAFGPSLDQLSVRARDTNYFHDFSSLTLLILQNEGEWKVDMLCFMFYQVRLRSNGHHPLQILLKGKISLFCLYSAIYNEWDRGFRDEKNKQRTHGCENKHGTIVPEAARGRGEQCFEMNHVNQAWHMIDREQLRVSQQECLMNGCDPFLSYAQFRCKNPSVVESRSKITYKQRKIPLVSSKKTMMFSLDGYGCISVRGRRQQKIIVPCTEYLNVIHRLHTFDDSEDCTVHRTRSQMLELIRCIGLYWPSMSRDVSQYIRTCCFCATRKVIRKRSRDGPGHIFLYDLRFHFVVEKNNTTYMGQPVPISALTQCRYACAACYEDVPFELHGAKLCKSSRRWGICFTCKKIKCVPFYQTKPRRFFGIE